jgi:hypothetical protein
MTKMNSPPCERYVKGILVEWNVNILVNFMALVIYFIARI